MILNPKRRNNQKPERRYEQTVSAINLIAVYLRIARLYSEIAVVMVTICVYLTMII